MKKQTTHPRIVEPNTIDVREAPPIKGTVWERYQEALDTAIADRKARIDQLEQLKTMLKKGRESGITLQQLGDIFGVTRERIRQLLK